MTIHHLPIHRRRDAGVSLFDMPRPDCDDVRHVQTETEITMRVDGTDQFVRVPVRAVYVDDGLSGWSLEIGPYSIDGADACALTNALVAYGRLSGDFRPVTEVTA